MKIYFFAATLLMFALTACSTSVVEETEPDQIETSFQLPDSFDIQGHRGARGLKPENTLPAFETALDLGVTTLELDVHFSSDGVVVIWHDPVIEAKKCRLDPEASVDAPDPDSLIFQGDKLRISNLTFAQLQAYLCDRNPEKADFPDQQNTPSTLAGTNYHISSLDQLFEFVEAYAGSDEKTTEQKENASAIGFNIETKRNPDAPENINDGFDGINPGPFETALLAVIEAHDLLERSIIQSFDHRSLKSIHAVNPDIRVAALTSARTTPNPKPASYAEWGASIWSPSFSVLTETLLKEAHDAGLLVIPWTVNDPVEMQTLIDLGVDGIITDRPDLLINQQ